jgi:hypothetical protein
MRVHTYKRNFKISHFSCIITAAVYDFNGYKGTAKEIQDNKYPFSTFE